MFDVYLRKAKENGKVIFPSEFCLTDVELAEADAVGKGKKSLESLLREKDVWEFSGQYMNDPVDIDAVEFKPFWFKTFTMDEALSLKLRNCSALLSVDPAFRLKQTNDFSGLVVTKTTPDNLVYVLEAKKKKVDAKQLVDEIFSLVATYKPWKVLVETVAAQILLTDILKDEMLKRNEFFVIEEVKSSNNETKAMRIRGLVPHYANGRIYHAPNLKDLENQLIEFPRALHDDIADALSYQVHFWKAVDGGTAMVEAPHGSLIWWKRQQKSNLTRIGSMFRDMMPQGHRR